MLSCLVALWGILFSLDWQVSQKMRQADLLLASRQPEAAEALYRQVAKAEPWRPLAWSDLAQQYLLQGHTPNALQVLEAAENEGRLAADGYAVLAQIYQNNGSIEKVEPALLKAYRLAETPADRAEILQELVRFYRSQFQFKDALARQQELTRISPSSSESRINEVLLQTILDADAGLADWRSLSDRPAWLQKWGEAVTTALSGSEEPRRWVMIGQAYGAVGEWDLAEYVFTRATGSSPAYAEAWGLLAEARQQQGKDGREAIEKALQLAPHSPAIRLLGALYYRRQFDYRNAVTLLQQNTDDQPQEILWRLELGHTLADAGRFEEAVQAYQKAAELNPSGITGLTALARFCVQYDYQVESVGLPSARQAVNLAPESAEASDVLGQVWFALGDTGQAAQAYRSALDHDPEYAPAWLHLGQMALADQDSVAARESLEKTIKLAAASTEGKLAARLLKQYFQISVDQIAR